MSPTVDDYKNAIECEATVTFKHDWCLAEMPEEVHQKLLHIAKQKGFDLNESSNPHISVMKTEAPNIHKKDWGKAAGRKVKVKILPEVGCENGFHVWVNCYSPELCELREHFQLPTLKKDDVWLVNFHMTIGTLKKPQEPSPRPQIRMSRQSHIDVESGMQHL